MTEDEMAGWHHRLDGCEFEQTPGNSGGQRSLASCSPRDHKESDMTQLLNNNKSFSDEYGIVLARDRQTDHQSRTGGPETDPNIHKVLT